MSGYRMFRISEIDLAHLDAPLIEHTVAEPIFQNLRIAFRQGFPVNPGLSRRSAYGIADKAHRHAKLLAEHSSKVICYSTEGSYILSVTWLPLGRTVEIHVLGHRNMLV